MWLDLELQLDASHVKWRVDLRTDKVSYKSLSVGKSIAGDYVAGHRISLSAYCNAASIPTVAATIVIGAFVFRPRRLTVTISCDLNRLNEPFEIPRKLT